KSAKLWSGSVNVIVMDWKRLFCRIFGHKPKSGFAGEWVTTCERCDAFIDKNGEWTYPE
ncbi:unnamed protein product, partial [marine sediment metagenome]